MPEPSVYRLAYEAAQRELAELLHERERIDKRTVTVRENLKALASLCEGFGSEVPPSPEADYLLENSALPDEILAILRAEYPGYHRATVIKTRLERLGHEMGKYQNPLATIHMILKRQFEAGKVETATNARGEKLYRAPRMTDALYGAPNSLRNQIERGDIPDKSKQRRTKIPTAIPEILAIPEVRKRGQ